MTSVFASTSKTLFATYECEIQFRDKVLGGVPKNPKVIEGYLRSKTGITNDEEIKQAMLRTLIELGADVKPDMTYEQLEEASNKLAAVKSTNGFKARALAELPEGVSYQTLSPADIDDLPPVGNLYLEDRQIKAAIKEAVNILYAGQRWGVTKKGPKNFTAERVFLKPQAIDLGMKEPDGVELLMVHASTPQGPRSSLSYHEYAVGPVIKFRVQALRDEINEEQWAEIWTLAQENGLGACRSQSYGKFDVIKWKKV